MIERFAVRLALEMKIVDLAEIDDLPFSTLYRWMAAETDVPFWDRRVESLAFLTCTVIRGIVMCQMEPTPEMFHLTKPPKEDSATEPDFPRVDQESIDRFSASMSAMG